jgi:hypothetical protein
MATSNRPTQGKRTRERALKEKQQEKNDRRVVKKQEKKDRPTDGSDDGVDPDLIGIIPGPQEPLEF